MTDCIEFVDRCNFGKSGLMSSGSVARGLGLSMCCLVLLGTMPVVSNLRPQSFDALSFALAQLGHQFPLSL